MHKTQRVEISKSTIIFTIFFILGLLVLWQIRDVLLLFFVAYIIMSALDPVVDRIEHYKIPRALGVIIIIALFAGVVLTLLFVGINPFLSELTGLTRQVGAVSDQFSKLPYASNLIDPQVIEQQIGNISQQAVSLSLSFFQNILSFLSVIIFAVYLSVSQKSEDRLVHLFFPKKEKQVTLALERVRHKLGDWLRGQLLLSLLIGISYFIVLSILNVKYALSLAILGGIFEIVPIIGPILSAIPGVIIGFTESPVRAGVIALAYLLVQQLEGHVVIPLVMRQAVGLNPLLILLAISIGGKLLGLGGVFLAVPIAVVIQIVLEEFYLNAKTKKAVTG